MSLNIKNFDDQLKMEELFRSEYSKQMPKKGEVIIPIGDYGVSDEGHTILYQFLEQVFAYEIENENVTLFVIPEEYGATINLVKDFTLYD